MNLIAMFVFGSLIALFFATAVVVIVLTESADPENANESTLTRLERYLIGKKREKAKSEQALHDKTPPR